MLKKITHLKTKEQQTFSPLLLKWYDQHGRHDLPWQQDRSLYRVWISEIMLQQTQVSTVIPYFERFMARFPDVLTLANATEDEVLYLWTGLGYYARARNLHKSAKIIRDQYAGQFPEDFDNVLALAGIGRSTAGAILAQALGQRHVILDGNVKRVLSRLYAIAGWPGSKVIETQLWIHAESLTPKQNLTNYTQAIMDLGATVCARKPLCPLCPVSHLCQAFASDQTLSLPTSKPRKTKPVKATHMLILKNEDAHVLLIQRPAKGIWGSLWSFPECELETDISNWSRNTLGLQLSEVRQGEPLRHTFSHYHLDITPLYAKANSVSETANSISEADSPLYKQSPAEPMVEPKKIVWYNTRQPDSLGLPAPVKSLLQQLEL